MRLYLDLLSHFTSNGVEIGQSFFFIIILVIVYYVVMTNLYLPHIALVLV